MRLAALLFVAATGCVVNDPAPVAAYPQWGYGYGRTNPTVTTPNPYEVSSLPPDPLYEQMTASPGDDSVWIDGYWHWNGYEWVWVGGRWEQQQEGYVYVEPNYDWSDGGYVYTPGYWSHPDQAPRGWTVHGGHDGRPTTVRPPPGQRPAPGNIGVAQPRPPRQPTRPGGLPPRAPQPGNMQPVYNPPPRYRDPVGPRAPEPSVMSHQPNPTTEPPPLESHEPYYAPPRAPQPRNYGGGGYVGRPAPPSAPPSARPSAPPPPYAPPPGSYRPSAPPPPVSHPTSAPPPASHPAPPAGSSHPAATNTSSSSHSRR